MGPLLRTKPSQAGPTQAVTPTPAQHAPGLAPGPNTTANRPPSPYRIGHRAAAIGPDDPHPAARAAGPSRPSRITGITRLGAVPPNPTRPRSPALMRRTRPPSNRSRLAGQTPAGEVCWRAASWRKLGDRERTGRRRIIGPAGSGDVDLAGRLAAVDLDLDMVQGMRRQGGDLLAVDVHGCGRLGGEPDRPAGDEPPAPRRPPTPHSAAPCRGHPRRPMPDPDVARLPSEDTLTLLKLHRELRDRHHWSGRMWSARTWTGRLQSGGSG